MPPSQRPRTARHNTPQHPDVLLYDRWPPSDAHASTTAMACPASRPGKSPPRRRNKQRPSHADLMQLKASVACILQMHVEGDPYVRHLHVTAVPPGRRKNSRARADPSGWPLYIGRRDHAEGPAVAAFDVVADEPAAEVAARLNALTAKRPREIVMLCASGLPTLPRRMLRVRQDHRARERRRHEPCVLVGQTRRHGRSSDSGSAVGSMHGGGGSGGGGGRGIADEFYYAMAYHGGGNGGVGSSSRAGGGGMEDVDELGGASGYTWVVLSGMEYLELRGLMVAAWADQLTIASEARELAGSSGYQYALMYCAMVDVILTEPDSSRLSTTKCDDATLVWRARAMAKRFRVPWAPMLQTMKDIARVERVRQRRPAALGGVDKFS